MTELYVGGFGLRNHYKTLKDAIDKAREGDTILLNKSVEIGTIIVTKNLEINGQNNTIKIQEGGAGLDFKTKRAIVKNVTIFQNKRCNGIVNETPNGLIDLENVTFTFSQKNDPRDIYSPIFASDTATVTLTNVTSDFFSFEASHISARHSTFGDFFGSQSALSASTIQLDSSTLTNIYLESDNLTGSTLTTYGECYCRVNTLDMGQINFLFYNDPEKTFRKKFKDSSFVKDDITMFTINNCEKAVIHDMRIATTEKVYQARLLQIIDTNLTLERSKKSKLLNDSLAQNSTITLIAGDTNEWNLFNSEIVNSNTTGKGQSSGYKKLQEMIGLASVKEQIENFMSVASMQAERAARGFAQEDTSNMNMVFGGAPGTGKTTVAKIIGQMLFEEHILPTNKFKVTTRKDFVSKYIGATAQQTHDVFMSALGGVLLIDEAYSLLPHGEQDHAQEAIDQLVMDITEHKGEILVIVAGYTNDMHEFIEKGNPGLKSRFPNWIEFPSYTCDDLLDILLLNVNKKNVALSQDDWDYLESRFIELFNATNVNGALDGNGRYIENFMNDLLATRDIRLANMKRQGYTLTNNDILTLTRDDIDQVINNRLRGR